MARCYKFSFLKLGAGSPRDERLNVGLAVFLDGNLDVRLLRSLTKLNALSLAYDHDTIRKAAEQLPTLDLAISGGKISDHDRLERLAEIAPFEFAPLGEFIADSAKSYESQISLLMKSFVEPEQSLKVSGRGKGTRLTSALKTAFRSGRVLALKGEDLSAHRVVPNVELATGLVADFVLKNGAMHVIETVDASSDSAGTFAAIKNIALSALTIEQARITYGDQTTVGRLVYHATAQAETAAAPALLAAEHQRIELINWSSADDQRRLLTTISTLAVPSPRKNSPAPINASTQRRLDIN